MTLKLSVVGTRDEFESETPEQMVGYLWKTAFMRETNPAAYMEEVARRVAMYNRSPVRYDTAENFLTDLAAAGLVSIIWD